MERPVRLALAAVTLALALFTLAPAKPGLPPVLKADEPAYYLMAVSLARDGDLRLGLEDVERAFQEFPYRPVDNLIVMTDDGWRSIFFGKPYVYSLFAAPFVRAFGANGMVLLNMLLLAAMVWMGAYHLGRFNDGATAALFAGGFFILSAGFAYVFWLQPEVLNMTSVAACLFLALREPPAGESRTGEDRAGEDRSGEEQPRGNLARRARRRLWTAALSGAVLMPAVYNKPMLALVALAPLFGDLRRRRWSRAGSWLAGAVLGLGLVAGVATALTHHPTPYLGVTRQGVTLCEPGVLPIAPPPGGGELEPVSPTGGAWSWIFRVPTMPLGLLAENLGYFLWGRHTGLLLYLPFAALAVLLFLAHGRRDGRRWVLLGSLALVALTFILFIPHNWQGGGGFIGNRYFVNVYPAFLFLVTRVRPRWLTVAGYGVGGLLLGPIVFTPFGANVLEPTLQAHVRNFPFRAFPLELSLPEVPGYRYKDVGDRRFLGRSDVFLPMGKELWVHAGRPVEILIRGTEPLGEAVFLVRSPAPENRIELELGRARETLELHEGVRRADWQRVTLEPGEPWRVRHLGETPVYIYRLLVSSSAGRIRHWTRNMPPNPCPYFNRTPALNESFFTGARLIYLGTAEAVDRDLYSLRWGKIQVPRRVEAGEVFTVRTRLFNTSPYPWAASGAAEVKLSYHWWAPDGEAEVWNGRRTALALPVPPGGRVNVPQEVEAPEAPGQYVLELDPLFEHVAWFSQRNQGNTFRAEVEVVPGPAPSDVSAAPGGEAPASGSGGGEGVGHG